MEVEYGFVVSDKRRSVWNVELEMVEIVKTICDRHHLRYFASGGTLLGAVRHRGFIPWDDDIDISMFREDYDKFIAAAKTELPNGFFLQIPETEEDYFYGHAKIRKNNTTAIRYIQYPEKYVHHQGVFIDIFPMDNIPDGKYAYRIHKFIALKIMQTMYYAKYYYRTNKHAPITKIKHRVCMFLLPSNKAIRRVYNIYEKWIKIPNRKITRKVGLTSTFYNIDNIDSWDRELFKTCIVVPFESTSICIPTEFDEILKETYGDYMHPVMGANLHGEVFFDLNRDYKDYYNGKFTFSKNDLLL